MGKRFEKELKSTAISMYVQGESPGDIAKSIQCSVSIFYRWLRSYDIELRRKSNAVDAKRKSIAEAYAGGMTGPEVANRFGCHVSSVYNFVRRLGGNVLSSADCHRRYSLIESSFDNTSPERNYWIGFILADGCILKNSTSKSVRVCLKQSDRGHLEKLRSFLGSSHPIKTYDNSRGFSSNSRMASLQVFSTRLASKLEELGIKPRKSMSEEMHEDLLMCVHAWRGVIDGDGWVSISTLFRPEIGLTGSQKICEQFADFTEKTVGKRASICPNKPIFKSFVTCSTAIDLARLLYGEGCHPALRRKEIAAHAIMAADWCQRGGTFIKRTGRYPLKLTSAKAEEIRLLASTGIKTKQLAAQFGVDVSTIQRVVTKATWK